MTKPGKGPGKKPGAPRYKWTPEIEAEIFKRLSEGESLRKICEDDWLPSRQTVNERRIVDAEFADQYARAREAQADHFFDEVIEIADGASAEDVAAARLRVDARKWAAGKLRPKAYGDKIDHTSSDGSMTPQPSRIELVAPSDDSKG